MTCSQIHSCGALRIAPKAAIISPDTWFMNPEAPISTSAPRLPGAIGTAADAG